MVFVETLLFSAQISKLISDESYGDLQAMLSKYPSTGVVIRGTHGCRKLRWGAAGVGKRGGIRVIYYWSKTEDHIIMFTAYSKSNTPNLSVSQRAELGKIVLNKLRKSKWKKNSIMN